ncbi:MAG: D-2-hydroxyacid dehydrogenase family protein [Actinobacteria bacterium]|nr:D-2-hydroxyacid dehydrogenase family protein [Actinomycetota bacterium]
MRIVVLDDYQGVALEHGAWSHLPAECEVRTVREHLGGDEELLAALAGAEIVVAMRERTAFTAARLAQLTDLRLLVTTGMGNVAIDVEAAAANGITVCGTGGVGSATVEHAWALILGWARSLPLEDANVREGRWQTTVGVDLAGATLGLVGFGRLGRGMVPVAKAFGMEVIAWSLNLDPEVAVAAGARPVAREELFREADVVSVHYKLGERSIGLVGAEELGLMKRTALLVNTSRGPIVDTAALLDALWNNRIAGAALDVYDTEPLPPDDPLRQAPRTVLTPHLGYVTGASYDVYFGEAIEDIAAFLAGDPIRVIAAP